MRPSHRCQRALARLSVIACQVVAYLMQTLRNTFATNRRTVAGRPRVVTTLERLDAADRRTAARPEEAVIAAQVFPAIAQLPESFRWRYF